MTGIAVTLAAAIEPAVRASRIPPVEALRARLDQAPARRARLRWLLVVFAVVGLAGLLVWPRDAGAAGAVRALVVYGVLLVATLLVPFLVPGPRAHRRPAVPPPVRARGAAGPGHHRPRPQPHDADPRRARGRPRARRRARRRRAARPGVRRRLGGRGRAGRAPRHLDPPGRRGRARRHGPCRAAGRGAGQSDRDLRPRGERHRDRRRRDGRRGSRRRRPAHVRGRRPRRGPAGPRCRWCRDRARVAGRPPAPRGRRRADGGDRRRHHDAPAGRRASPSGPCPGAAARPSSSAGPTRRPGWASREPTRSRSPSIRGSRRRSRRTSARPRPCRPSRS